MFNWLKKLFSGKEEEKVSELPKIVHDMAVYCSGNPDLDTLNKIVETNSLTIMKRRGRLTPEQIIELDRAYLSWSKGDKTPFEFKEAFRGGK